MRYKCERVIEILEKYIAWNLLLPSFKRMLSIINSLHFFVFKRSILSFLETLRYNIGINGLLDLDDPVPSKIPISE